QGTAPFQADQPMGSHKLTGMAAGTAATDSPTLAQVQSGIVAHAASVGGSADAVTLTFSPAFGAYTARMRFRFTAAGANTLTNPTVNVDGLGAKTIKKLNGQALVAGDIAGAGHVVDCVYDGTDVLMVSASAVAMASTAVAGIVELATTAEARTGTDTARAVTPAGLGSVARLKLTGNMSIYVRSDGNDSNDGSANDSGHAKLTWQAALDLAQTFDLNGFTLTIRCDQASASFTAGMIIPPMVGQKNATDFVIQGNTGAPANIAITSTGAHAIEVLSGTRCRIAGFKLSSNVGNLVHTAGNGTRVELGAMDYSDGDGNHIACEDSASVLLMDSYAITGDASNHFFALGNSSIRSSGAITVTLTGTPAFILFAQVVGRSVLLAGTMTFSGNAIGVRYIAGSGGFIYTNGGNNFFPGNSAGSTQTGGQYF
ncbi:MAG: hypothetical protein AB7F09_17235, partial [Parvibaculaceae bacterium]